MSNYIVVDLETTGLDPFRGSILSIGAVKRKTGEEFYGECKVRADAIVDDKALKINGFTPDQIHCADKQTEGDLITRFFVWAGDKALLIGMNPYYDYSFLQAAADRAGLINPFNHRTIDLHTLAIAYAIRNKIEVPAKGFYTDGIYRMISMPQEPKPHNALTGARMENKAFTKLFYSLVK